MAAKMYSKYRLSQKKSVKINKLIKLGFQFYQRMDVIGPWSFEKWNLGLSKTSNFCFAIKPVFNKGMLGLNLIASLVFSS